MNLIGEEIKDTLRSVWYVSILTFMDGKFLYCELKLGIGIDDMKAEIV